MRESHFSWKILDMGTHDNYCTSIAKVPTGWLIKETIYNDKNSELRKSCSITHISEPSHQSELAWEALLDDEGFHEYDEVYKYVRNELKEREKLNK